MSCEHPDSKRYIVGVKRVETKPPYPGASLRYEEHDVGWCRACGALLGFKPSDSPSDSAWQKPDVSNPTPNPFGGWFRWTVEFHVLEKWVADGFDLTDRRAHDMITNACPYIRMTEIDASVLTRPDDAEVAKAQGYKSVEEWQRSRKR